MDYPNKESFDYSVVFRKRILPVLKDLENDFFGTVGDIDNSNIKNGMRTMFIGLRMLVKSNPEYHKKYAKLLEKEDSNVSHET